MSKKPKFSRTPKYEKSNLNLFGKDVSNARILEALSKEGTTRFKEIKKITKLNSRTVTKRLKELTKINCIRKESGGYRLLPDGITKLRQLRAVGDINAHITSQIVLLSDAEEKEIAASGTVFLKLDPEIELNSHQMKTIQKGCACEVQDEFRKRLSRYKNIEKATIIMSYNRKR